MADSAHPLHFLILNALDGCHWGQRLYANTPKWCFFLVSSTSLTYTIGMEFLETDIFARRIEKLLTFDEFNGFE